MHNILFLADPETPNLFGFLQGQTALGILKAVGLAILVWIIGSFVIGKVVTIAGKTMDHSKMDASLKPFLKSILNASLKVLLLLAVASTLGMQVTSFVAILSAAAFAVGLALQGGLSNFAGGVMILSFRPFRVGDVITAQGYTGKVKEIQIFHTILLTADNQTIILPNGPLSNGSIQNLTLQTTRRVDLTFGIGYKDDINKARTAIYKVLGECPHVHNPEETMVIITSLGDSSVNFGVRPWTATEYYWDVFWYMQEHIKKEFDAQGIGIPFPQMDIHISKEE